MQPQLLPKLAPDEEEIETPKAADYVKAQLDFDLLEKVFPNLNQIKFKPRSPQNELLEEGV